MVTGQPLRSSSKPDYSGIEYGPTDYRAMGIESAKAEVFVEQDGQGTKADGEKLDRFDLLPWDIIMEVAELYGIGARKYDDRNWEKGMSWGRLVRALCSHLAKFLLRKKYDPVDGQRHIISVVWCAIALAYYEKHGLGTDDRAPCAVSLDDMPMTNKYKEQQARYQAEKPQDKEEYR